MRELEIDAGTAVQLQCVEQCIEKLQVVVGRVPVCATGSDEPQHDPQSVLLLQHAALSWDTARTSLQCSGAEAVMSQPLLTRTGHHTCNTALAKHRAVPSTTVIGEKMYNSSPLLLKLRRHRSR